MDRSMKDPATASSRIYIGNLGENVMKSEIENIFRKYGNIRGVLLSRNFGFVQYDSDESANNAIANENEQKYFNRKIIVRNAMKGNNNDKNIGGQCQNNQGNANNNANAPKNIGNIGNSANNMNVGIGGNKGNPDNNMRGGRPQWRNNNRNNRNMDSNLNMQNGRDRSPLDGGRPFNNADRWGGGDLGNDRPNQNFRQNNLLPNDMGAPLPNIGNSATFGPTGSVGGGGNLPRVGLGMLVNENINDNTGRGKIGSEIKPKPIPENRTAQSIRAKYPDANDCEIIVVAKSLTEYAEAVEARLKRLGLLVDLLFPNPDVPVGKVLANIASRGCLYAIVIAPDNHEMRSVTLNILYGQPAEHRNMPLDDAIEFMVKNFQQLMRGEKVAGDFDDQKSQLASIPLSITRHPESMQYLINILAENRTLTVLQYDALSKYLLERREAQYKSELGDTRESIPSSDPNIQNVNASTTLSEPDKEKELQKRIMDILNKPSITTLHTESPLSKQNQPDTLDQRKVLPAKTDVGHDHQEPQLLNDPKVQKALDSLFNF